MEHQRRLSQIRQQGREERRRQEQASQARRGRKQRQQLRKEERRIAHDVQLLLRTESADSAITMVAGSASRLEIREDLVVDRLLHACFGPIPRGCMTMQAEASSVGRSKQCFHEDVQTLAAAVFCCILSFVESMASHVLWGMPKQGQIAWGAELLFVPTLGSRHALPRIVRSGVHAQVFGVRAGGLASSAPFLSVPHSACLSGHARYSDRALDPGVRPRGRAVRRDTHAHPGFGMLASV